MTALLAVPGADRAERRFPLLLPLALTGAGLLTRYELVDPGVPHTAPALWLFALGWAIARSRTAAQRCVVSAIAVMTVPGFFDNAAREGTLLAGISPALAVAASLAAGVAYWALWMRVMPAATRWRAGSLLSRTTLRLKTGHGPESPSRG